MRISGSTRAGFIALCHPGLILPQTATFPTSPAEDTGEGQEEELDSWRAAGERGGTSG
jgi:hypothetical protein